MGAGLVFWFTGLSGAGKTMVATLAAAALEEAGRTTLVLDGDALRETVGRGLGFSRADILENNRRVAEHCALRRAEADALLVPLISPLIEGRARARAVLSPGFYEVWIAADLATTMARDPKGLYARAKRGEIPDMIGYSPGTPYEAPATPDLTIETAILSAEESARQLSTFIMARLTA
jgi:bifunctional enzyme CysN/CysC